MHLRAWLIASDFRAQNEQTQLADILLTVLESLSATMTSSWDPEDPGSGLAPGHMVTAASDTFCHCVSLLLSSACHKV